MQFNLEFDFDRWSHRVSRSVERASEGLKQLNLDKLERIGQRVARGIERGVKRVDFDRLEVAFDGLMERIERGVDWVTDPTATTQTGAQTGAQTVQLEIRGKQHRLHLELGRDDRLPAIVADALGLYGLDGHAVTELLAHDLPAGTILEVNSPDLYLRLSIKEQRP